MTLSLVSCGSGVMNNELITCPEYDYQVISEDIDPSVTFPYPVIQKEAEDIFSITCMGSAVPGRYRWSANTLSFIPDTPLTRGKRYVLVFDGLCGDVSGKDRLYRLCIPFYVLSPEYTPLYLSGSYPSEGSFITTRQEIRLTFSEALDESSIENSFRLVPETPAETTVSGNTLVLSPLSSFPDATTLTLTFPKGRLQSVSGKGLEQDTELVYRVQEHTQSPEVAGCTVCINATGLGYPEIPGSSPTDLAGDEVFRLNFTRAMDRRAVEGHLFISPDLPFDCIWQDTASLVVIPRYPLTPETSYLLRLGGGATDTGGIHIADEYSLALASSSPFLTVERMELLGDGITLTSFDKDTAETISLGPGGSDYLIALGFSLPVTEVYEKQNVQENIVFSCVFPPSGGSPVPVSYSWESDSRLVIGYSGIAPSGPEEDRYYMISLIGGPEGVSVRGGVSFLEETAAQLLRSIE